MKKANYHGYVDYFYPRAKWMEENCLIGNLSYTGPEADENISDPLMQQNPNYNCVSRTYEGFNNVLEDLWNKEDGKLFGKRTPEQQSRIRAYKTEQWDVTTWLWSFMFHRATGSGFSGEEDHGYRNSIVTYFGEHTSPHKMMEMVRNCEVPMFTSGGNIPPHPKKGQTIVQTLEKYQYESAGVLTHWLETQDTKPSIRRVTDFLNERNQSNGIHRWNFPFSMAAADAATYFPQLVDDMSDLYCGKNAMLSIQEMYDKPKGWSNDRLYTYALQDLTEVLGTSPMAHEDTLCIYYRFLLGVSRLGDFTSPSGLTKQLK